MLNLNFACLKLLRWLEDGDIESNPGPRSFKIAKFVQGSFHQGHVKFGETVGIQCACNQGGFNLLDAMHCLPYVGPL